ncbi:MAG: gephyrin-like molybdotransferase Glp [Acidobacteriaceae bacterium]
MQRVLSFEDASAEVERHAMDLRRRSRASEILPLAAAGGRVLAEGVVCDRDLPPFARATRDGYAVLSSEGTQSRRCIGQVRAGQEYDGELQEGECVEIMTGAPVPAGAGAVGVIMVEDTRREGERVHFERTAAAGENVVSRGSEARQGAMLIPSSSRLDHPQLAVAAAVGAARVTVYKRPEIAVLCTGDEIVPIDGQPGPAQIRNSNAYSLAAQIKRAGGHPLLLPIAPDETTRLRELLQQGLQHDLLLISGGVSMGKHDLVEPVLEELGAEFYFTGAKIQPGKPIVFGSVSVSVKEAYFLGLPGNPVSAMVTFELFARPLVAALAGEASQPLLPCAARLSAPVRAKAGLTRFLPAQLTPAASLYVPPSVAAIAWQGSGDIVSITRANCWLIVPPDRAELDAGEVVTVLLR